MGLKAIALALALALGLVAAPASAADYAYMSGAQNPDDSGSYDAAMIAAFGPGQWDRLYFDDSTAYSSYSMLYIDGSADQGTSFYSWLDSARLSELEAWVNAGGRLFINAAVWDQQGVLKSLLFGATTKAGQIDSKSTNSEYGYAVDPGSPLFAGAGDTWKGNYFAGNAIGLATGYAPLITGDDGFVILAGGSFGNGYVMLGGLGLVGLVARRRRARASQA